MTTYTIADVHSKKATSQGLVDLTNEEKQKLIDEWNAYESESATRKLAQIKEIRLQKLIETDYLANSDLTMPANHTDEAAYDALLARDSESNLTHSVWSKP